MPLCIQIRASSCPARGAGLGGLVLVVGEQQVRAAAVDVEADAEDAAPPSPSTRCASPGARDPTARARSVSSPVLARLPQREVQRVLLAIRALDPLALVHVLQAAVRERAVVGVGAHAKVDVAAGWRRRGPLDQRIDVGDDWTDRLRGQRLVGRDGPAPARRCRRGSARSSPRPARRSDGAWARAAS